MKKIATLLLIFTIYSWALTLEETPKEIVLKGENGGLVDGNPWYSKTLKNKVNLLLYVDPDKQSDNKEFLKTLHSKNYDKNRFSFVAIINLKATWLPNIAIEKKLKSEQSKSKNTIYVKDKTKYLVKEWKLSDDDINIVIFNKQGKVVYIHSGIVDKKESKIIFDIVEKLLK